MALPKVLILCDIGNDPKTLYMVLNFLNESRKIIPLCYRDEQFNGLCGHLKKEKEKNEAKTPSPILGLQQYTVGKFPEGGFHLYKTIDVSCFIISFLVFRGYIV